MVTGAQLPELVSHVQLIKTGLGSIEIKLGCTELRRLVSFTT